MNTIVENMPLIVLVACLSAIAISGTVYVCVAIWRETVKEIDKIQSMTRKGRTNECNRLIKFK